ncbi:glycosyltransferase [Rhodococcoides fascians]|uniref:glycosyltransferase n=1 Tax=Rhodococcoides fascians TaxID=1828 RepID=UPI001D396787|nr:glycosyltransferase [Rhodococcus fascians]CAH0153362.1 putative glycosyltransferase Rv1514c [Rhodococcus fascians]
MPTDTVLSVITISYRDPDGLARTLASVAEQTYGSIEHIVIDGGSGPEVEKLLEDTAPSFWQSEPDAGRYDAMNQGIDRATGDVVWLMHSGDCFAARDSAEIGMAALCAAGGVRDRWGYGRARIVGDPLREGREWGYSPFEMRNFALGIRPIPHQAALFGMDLVRALGHYDVGFGLAADHLYMLEAARREHPVVIDSVLCDFDAGGAGSVRPQREHFADIRRSWDAAGYYPWGRLGLTTLASRIVEYTARSKYTARSMLSRRTRVGGR